MGIILQRDLAMRLAALSLLLSLAAARLAFADGNATIAEALYRDAIDAFKSGRYAEACPKFAESQHLDPQRGTLANLARCHEREGKRATAWSDYVELLELSKRDGDAPRTTYATQRIAELEAKLPRVKLAQGDGPLIKEMKVDGKVLSAAVLGTAFPVDAGAHTIVVVSEDGQTWHQEFAADERKTVVVTLHAPRKALPTPPPASLVTAPPASPRATRSRSWQRPLAIGVAAGGIAGLTVGGILGAVVLAMKSDVTANCIGNVCNAKGFNAQRSAWDLSTGSTVAFVAGGVLFAGGAILWFTAPRKVASGARIVPIIEPRSAGISLEGAW